MASALLSSATHAAFVGASSYAFCRVSNQPNPFEKAVLVTMLVGFTKLADLAINHLQDDEYQQEPLTQVVSAVAALLAIPCTLYAGRVFNFKAANYPEIVCLTSLGYTITYGLRGLYNMLPKIRSA